jgi:serine/threonine-protein kinase/endoribonuclease IRE1
MELCDCSLTQCIDNIDKKINLEFSKPDSGLLQQIVFGLNFLHGIGIVHRDIKPSNVLVKFQSQSNSPTKTPNNKPLLKLADFGISKKLDAVEKDVTTKRRGSTGWMAPELFATPAEYTKAVDVFAAGLVLFYASTTGSHPFAPDDSATTDIGSNLNFEACQDSIKKEKPPKKLIMLNGSPGIYNLIDWMIQPKFNDRPVIEKVLEHPYFWNADQALNFVRQVSEKIEGIKCPSEEHSTFIQPLENLKDQLFSSNWEDELTPKVKENLNFRRKNYPYDGTSVAYLIRAIRNKV